MSLNSYLSEAASKGYLANASTAAAIVHNIDPKSGKRIVIIAFAATAGTEDDTVYFMNPTKTTTNGAVLSGITTVVLTADPLDPSGNIIASSDHVCLQLDDGTFHYTTLSAWQTSNLTATLTDATSSSCADDSDFWNFGVYGDNGHFAYKVATTTQVTPEAASGLFYAPNKGYPMKVYQLSAADLAGANHIDYVTIGYIKQ